MESNYNDCTVENAKQTLQIGIQMAFWSNKNIEHVICAICYWRPYLYEFKVSMKFEKSVFSMTKNILKLIATIIQLKTSSKQSQLVHKWFFDNNYIYNKPYMQC